MPRVSMVSLIQGSVSVCTSASRSWRYTDVLEIRDHPLPLRVEPTNETHSRLTPQWHTQWSHEFAKDRQQFGTAMHMLVGVDMGRHPTHQAVKLLHLSAEFATHGWDITDIELAFSFTPDIPMQPH